MKHILDQDFEYTPSFETDIRKTFERVQKNQQPEQGNKSRQGSTNTEEVTREH
jgi:hypothetical protein